MSAPPIITQDIKALNRAEFDRVTALLNGQGNVVAKIKAEIMAIRNKFASMIEILYSYPDDISVLEKQLYDVQCQAFLHSVFMYLGFRDSSGNLFIHPVTPTSQTSPISLTIHFPHYTMEHVIADIDNITVDIINWDLYIGTTAINALRSAEIVRQFSVVVETPHQYFSRDEFITGVSGEIEKILLFNSQVCRLEQMINYGLRYISELKNIGLYS